ncbi:MAG: hypothetical protein LBD25_07860 [Coriobacteriales bacterium]|jgi:hypothetical protein|nr:hypothetical protein [Coriobacteriales bacterium]
MRDPAREALYQALSEGDFDQVLAAFDQDRSRVLRDLARLTYAPGDALCGQAVAALRGLSERRAAQDPEFFREVIRRRIWGMNEEGGNIDWSAPECVAAVIAGSPSHYREFVTVMFCAAADEPIFADSLRAALKLLKESDPSLLDDLPDTARP